jgi:hypothetical protein
MGNSPWWQQNRVYPDIEENRKALEMQSLSLYPVTPLTEMFRFLMRFIYDIVLQGDQKVCALDDHSTRNTQKYFKQFQSLTMITQLELGITDGVSVSLVSPLPWRSAAKQSD